MYDWDYVLAIKAVLLKEEQVTDDDGGDDAGEIGNQSARHGIPCLVMPTLPKYTARI